MRRPKIVLECAKEHQGDIEKAKEMIRKAKQCGADAVKFQAYSLADLNPNHSNYKRYYKCWLNLDQLKELKQYADDFKIDFYCSVFSKSIIKSLSEFTNEVKIPSTYLSQEDFVKECINHFDIIHMSTGMHKKTDILKYYRNAWSYASKLQKEKDILLYHCVSLYPTLFQNARLGRLRDSHWLVQYDGFSDHSIGMRQATLAWFLGATIIEKHFSLRSDAPGWCATTEEIETFTKTIDELLVGIQDSELTEEEKRNYAFYKEEYK
jgi:sialic acid synthase SpsE